jgi:hypothetical protein
MDLGRCQHAPDDHALATSLREALGVMTGLFWDVGENAGEAGRSA